MEIPLVMYATSASQSLPVFTVLLVRGRHPPAPYLRITTWCCFLVLADVFNISVMYLQGNNLWTSYYTLPAEVGLTLWILAAWQANARMQRLYMYAIVLVVLGTAAVLLATDPAVTFEVWVAPTLALIALAKSVHTLVHRSLLSRQPLTTQAWFGVCLGLSLFWLLSVPMPPFANAILNQNIKWVDVVYQARAWVMIVSFMLMSWGILCSRDQTAFSGRS